MEVFDQIKRLRSSTLIKERNFGRVSSFNFTKKAFFDSKWNELTTRARGLFIDTENGKIVARGYDKFFNLDENQNNKRSVLKKKLAFPVHAYRKENGFLGLIYWEEEYNRIRFATKSSLDGPYVQMLEEAFWDTVKYPIEVINVLRETKGTILVEVIDPVNDPHIIEYDDKHIVILDIVRNQWNSERIPYSKLMEYSRRMGIPCKQLCETYETWVDLEAAMDNWLTEDFREDGEPIEGYVVVDRNGFMFKVKTGYYTKWKKRRWKAGKIMTGEELEDDDEFLKWVYEKTKDGFLKGNESLIYLRNQYEDLG